MTGLRGSVVRCCTARERSRMVSIYIVHSGTREGRNARSGGNGGNGGNGRNEDSGRWR